MCYKTLLRHAMKGYCDVLTLSDTHAHSRTDHNSQKAEKPKCSSTLKEIHEMWYIHTME